MLSAWRAFDRCISRLHHVGEATGVVIVRSVVDAVTALNAVVSASWTSPFTDEFNAWTQVDPDTTSLDSLRNAAPVVAAAGDHLIAAWHAETEAAMYDHHDLTPAQREFIATCARARATLVPATSAR